MRGTLRAAALVGVCLVLSCGGPDGAIPTFVEPDAPATPGTVAVVPAVVAPGGANSWTDNGLKVTIIGDEWGPGSCHTNGGTRTLLIENVGDLERHSLLAAFTDDQPVCATSKTPTGKPTKTGPDNVKPGEAITVSYTVTLPTGKDGVCTVQADDCWGPGGIQGCAFVIGDSFKVADSKCDKVCVENPTTTKTPICSKWSECSEAGDGCEKTRQCVETTRIDYVCKADVETERTWTERDPCDCPVDPVCFCHVECAAGSCQESPAVNGVQLCLPPSGFTNGHGGEMLPPPPHFPSPNLHHGGSHFRDVIGQCPAICVDDPKGSVSQNSSGNPFRASATFEDTGAWRLRIHASSRESECLANAPDYWKRTVPGSTVCDERGSLSTSYSWAGHGAEWWRAVLELNGSIVDAGPCVRNPFN